MTAANKKAFLKRMAEGRAKAANAETTPMKKEKSAQGKAKSAKVHPARTIQRAVPVVAPRRFSKVGAIQVPVPNVSNLKGLSYIEEVNDFADAIHKASFTGDYKRVPVYRISKKDAKHKALEALKITSGKTVRNAKLKV